MQKENFHIGCEFYTATGKWRCTDIGTRVIIAIKLDKKDESWYNGPPYASFYVILRRQKIKWCRQS